ncbi:MAG: inorganic phosphate transporter [Nitrososphaerales archaeon]
MVELVIVAIVAALFFDFYNGMNDAANSIATVIGSRTLKPLHAVSVAAIANFVGPFVFGVAVATTVGKGLVDPGVITVYVVIAGVIGAISWIAFATHSGIPISASHTLLGGFVGAGIAAGGLEAIVFEGFSKVLTFMVVSPLAGLGIAFGLTIFILHVLKRKRPYVINRVFGRLQIISATFFSLTHGANDGQKTMGIIVAALVAGGILDSFYVPYYVIIMAASAIALGTFFGGFKVIKTMGLRLTALKPYQGFCAETGGGVILTFMAQLGIPVSTTHAIAGSIMGVGATRRLSAVRWGVGRTMIYAWIITIPARAAIGALFYKIMVILNLI